MVRYYCSLMLIAIFCATETVTSGTVSLYTIFVNDDQVGFNSIHWVDRSLPVHIACRMTVANDNVVMKKIVGSRIYTLANTATSYYDHYVFLNYTLLPHDKQSVITTYRCVDRSRPYAPNYAQVTISFSLELPSTLANTLPPQYTHPPTFSPGTQHATLPLTGIHSTEETHTASPKILGLNPLIYSISVLILLGSLALIALLTCWIRVRRSNSRRQYQLTSNPQDYLDYISDNDLTPLSASEFVASLEERPPSYGESEQMRSETREGQNGQGIEPAPRSSLTRILSPPSLDSRLNSSDNMNASDGDSCASIPNAHNIIAGDCESMSERLVAPPATRVPLSRLPSTSTVANRRHSTLSASTESDHDERSTTVTSMLLQPTITTTSPTHVQPNLSFTSHNQAIESSNYAVVEGNNNTPESDTLRSAQTTDFERSSSITDHQATSTVCGLSSRVDALLSMDLNPRNGNGTHEAQLEPLPLSESEAAVGLLIDLT